MNEYSELSSNDGISQDGVMEDSENSEDGIDWLGELLYCVVVVAGVTVSAREREVKRPETLGWVFQASVVDY
jgi:hypothetical protein